MDWYPWVRRALFARDAEQSHDLTLQALSCIGRSPLRAVLGQKLPSRPVTCMGLTFDNPVGLAAGLDKNGTCIDAFSRLGFGFIEIGTVTPRPQPGNPKPRMFRLVEHDAIINRMGFNNHGVDFLLEQVKKRRSQGILGINIGKNKDTPESEAVSDYLLCMEKVYPFADYITINISSPNTPGLRDMQHGEHLQRLLEALKGAQAKLQVQYQTYVPLVVKIAPDLTGDEIRLQSEIFNQQAIDGVIATNTTLSREAVAGHPYADEAGGLSGRPVREASTAVIRALRSELRSDIPIIGVGGIDSLDAAQEKIAAGASLVQVYTGLIYQGPQLIRTLVHGL